MAVLFIDGGNTTKYNEIDQWYYHRLVSLYFWKEEIFVKSKSLTEDFVHTIERKILSGEWKTGDRLLPLRELADSMKVSRSVVNAGIAELAKAGYLKIVPRKWTEVADWQREGTLQVLEGLSREGLLADESLDSVLEARRLIECECIQLACIHATKEEIEELGRHIESEISARTLKERVANDMKLHHMISVMSGNMVYPLIIKSFEKTEEEFVTIFYKNSDVFEYVVNMHKEIYSNLKERNVPGAREAMERLLRHGEQKVRKVSQSAGRKE